MYKLCVVLQHILCSILFSKKKKTTKNNTLLYESWIATDYFCHCSEQHAKHWSKYRTAGKIKTTGNIRSLQPMSRGRKQKKSSAPRSFEARNMQDNGNALKHANPVTEIQVNLEIYKNTAFEWGACTTSPTSFLPPLELENWESEVRCVNNSHPFWHPAFQIIFQTKKTIVFLFFFFFPVVVSASLQNRCFTVCWTNDT